MKHLITITLTITASIIVGGCASSAPVPPSQNCDLNKISNSHGKNKPGLMQKNLNNWLKNEWTPTVNKDKKIQKKYLKKETTTTNDNTTEEKYVEDKERNFTLQEYVDKASAYIKAHPSNEEESHVKKLESMPVIGN